MQYQPGGDLMNLLIKREVLSEEESRFYISEIVSIGLIVDYCCGYCSFYELYT